MIDRVTYYQQYRRMNRCINGSIGQVLWLTRSISGGEFFYLELEVIIILAPDCHIPDRHSERDALCREHCNPDKLVVPMIETNEFGDEDEMMIDLNEARKFKRIFNTEVGFSI